MLLDEDITCIVCAERFLKSSTGKRRNGFFSRRKRWSKRRRGTAQRASAGSGRFSLSRFGSFCRSELADKLFLFAANGSSFHVALRTASASGISRFAFPIKDTAGIPLQDVSSEKKNTFNVLDDTYIKILLLETCSIQKCNLLLGALRRHWRRPRRLWPC